VSGLGVRESFNDTTTDDEGADTISCLEESGQEDMGVGVSGVQDVDPGEVGPLGPDNDPGGGVSICEDSEEPVQLYYEKQVLSPVTSKQLGSAFRTVELNETIPLKNRSGVTMTNVVEVEAIDWQGHERRRLAIVEKEPLQPEPIIDIDPQRTRTAADGRLNIAARVFDGLVHTVTVETRSGGSIYDFAEVHNGSTRTDVRIRETLDRPRGRTTVVIRAVDIRGRVHTEELRLEPVRTETPTETTPFQTATPVPTEEPDTVEPPTPVPDTPTATATPTLSPTNTSTSTPSVEEGAVFGDNFGFAAVAIALLSVAALARRRLV
jgi:hypothetical protein